MGRTLGILLLLLLFPPGLSAAELPFQGRACISLEENDLRAARLLAQTASIRHAIRATGDTLRPSLIMVTGALLNIILDPLLIFGWGPFPRLGIAGAALATVADAHRPFPALIVDRAWNVRGGNANAFALFERYASRPPAADGTLNALALCVDPEGLRPRIRNWGPFMVRLLTQFRLELAREDDAALRALVERIEGDPEFRAAQRRGAEPSEDPVATLVLEADGRALALFTLHSNLAVARDATLADLRVETFFPADAATRAALLALDAELAGSGTGAAPGRRSSAGVDPR